MDESVNIIDGAPVFDGYCLASLQVLENTRRKLLDVITSITQHSYKALDAVV